MDKQPQFRWYVIDPDYEEIPDSAIPIQTQTGYEYRVLQVRYPEGPRDEWWWGEWETIK